MRSALIAVWFSVVATSSAASPLTPPVVLAPAAEPSALARQLSEPADAPPKPTAAGLALEGNAGGRSQLTAPAIAAAAAIPAAGQTAPALTAQVAATAGHATTALPAIPAATGHPASRVILAAGPELGQPGHDKVAVGQAHEAGHDTAGEPAPKQDRVSLIAATMLLIGIILFRRRGSIRSL